MRFVVAAVIMVFAFLFARMAGRGLEAGVVSRLEGGAIDRRVRPGLFWSTVSAHAVICLELIVCADAALLGRLGGVADAARALLG
jgi:hypothetical protein